MGTRKVPIIEAFWKGQPVATVPSRLPAECDHAGATWSQDIALDCPRCGAPMFLPPRILAGLDMVTIQRMKKLYRAAGYPWFDSRAKHFLMPDDWVIVPHPLFEAVGGIPVKPDIYRAWLDEHPEVQLEGGVVAWA